jgi:hypothetical protein
MRRLRAIVGHSPAPFVAAVAVTSSLLGTALNGATRLLKNIQSSMTGEQQPPHRRKVEVTCIAALCDGEPSILKYTGVAGADSR